MSIRLRCVLFTLFALVLTCPIPAGSQVFSTQKVPAVSISVSPAQATVFAGETLRFTALVGNGGDSAVMWSLAEQDGGAITRQGLYTAPKVPGVYHVRVVSASDPNQQAIVTIIVLAYCDPPSGFAR